MACTTTIFAGYSGIATDLQNKIGDPSLQIVSPAPPFGEIHWLRDTNSVSPFTRQLLNGRYPSRRREERIIAIAKRLFPYSCPSTMEKIPSGRGFFKKGLITSIEGGNIKFWQIGERRGAFIGITSVLFTMDDKGTDTAGAGESPHVTCPESAEAEVLREDPPLCHRWNRAIERIAKKCGIDPANLIVLEHGVDLLNGHPLLHIDLNLLLGMGTTVFLHEPWQVIQTFQTTYPEGTPGHDQYKNLIETMLMHVGKAQRVFNNNRRRLAAAGFEVEPIMGLVDLGTSQGGQFLNALMLRTEDRLCCVSPAISWRPQPLGCLFQAQHGEADLAKPFFDTLRAHNISVIFCNTYGMRCGGLHCVTTETSEGTRPPQYIPVTRFPTAVRTVIDLRLPETFSDRQCRWLIPDVSLHDTKSGLSVQQPAEGIAQVSCHTYSVIVSVPLEGLHVTVYLRDKPTPIGCHLLPGHSRCIQIPTRMPNILQPLLATQPPTPLYSPTNIEEPCPQPSSQEPAEELAKPSPSPLPNKATGSPSSPAIPTT